MAGTTRQDHLQAHALLFAQHVVPRERKLGSNPGEPKGWGGQGSFFNVSHETIRTVMFRDDTHAQVTTDWGYMLPGGQTMFVLKRSNGRWLIDGLKWLCDGVWKVAHL